MPPDALHPAELTAADQRRAGAEAQRRGASRHHQAFELPVKMRRPDVGSIERPDCALRERIEDQLLKQRGQVVPPVYQESRARYHGSTIMRALVSMAAKIHDKLALP